MIRNYFLIAIRNLKNNLFFSSINVFGLSIGVGCCLILALFIIDQLNFDKYNEHAQHIYRVVNKQFDGKKSSYVGVTQGPLGPELIKNFPEVIAATRVGFQHGDMMLEGKEPEDVKLMAVDSAYFRIFTVPFKQGSFGTPDGMVISESAAKRMFGNDDPIGKIVSISKLTDFKVTGVYYDFPTQSHLRGDYIISFVWIEKTQRFASLWVANSYFNYVLMPEHFDAEDFNARLNTLVHKFTPESWKSYEYFLQPLLSIHLANDYSPKPSGSPGKIILVAFSAVGCIILLLACFNYMNMATARSARRAMEVGVRKVMGAHRMQLIGQFISESFLLCTLSFLLGILWADLAIPFFNAFTGFKLSLSILFNDSQLIALLVAGVILLSIIAGSYPAFFLSKFLPVSVLKGQTISDSGRRLRKGLVLVQFTMTSLLIILALIVFRQVEFLRTKDLGFAKDNILLFDADRGTKLTPESFIAELKSIPGVAEVSSTSTFPGWGANRSTFKAAHAPVEEEFQIEWIFTDHAYIPTLKLQLIAGRNFLDNGTDKNKGVIINERAAAALGWKADEAVGQRVSGFIFRDSLPGEIIGVIRDFHIAPLRNEIEPLVIGYQNGNNGYIVHVEGTDPFAIRDAIKEKVTAITGVKSFDAVFMDDFLERIYTSDKKTGQFFNIATLLAIVIGCLGLYALSAYEGEQRMKELGIRKIMGASVLELVTLLSRNFLKLVVIALIIAVPLAYFLGNMWLHTFAYQIGLSAGLFFESASYILLLAWVTILTQTIKASSLNPVDTLRHE